MKDSIGLFKNDLPEDIELFGDLAIDTEAMGLNIKRDRLCLVQICDSNQKVVMVQFTKDSTYDAPVLKSLLEDESRQKIFHYGRFDISIMMHYLGVEFKNVFCTKIASKFSRTYTDHHGLKTIVSELIGVDLKKEKQCSNWGADVLSDAQKNYAKNDVIYLHKLRGKLMELLEGNGRQFLAVDFMAFLPTICKSDIEGFEEDMFHH